MSDSVNIFSSIDRTRILSVKNNTRNAKDLSNKIIKVASNIQENIDRLRKTARNFKKCFRKSKSDLSENVLVLSNNCKQGIAISAKQYRNQRTVK
jgi:arginine utilization protein RocB